MPAGTPVVLGTDVALDTSSDLVVTITAVTANRKVLCFIHKVRATSTPAASTPTGGLGADTWALVTAGAGGTLSYDVAGGSRGVGWVYEAKPSSPSGTEVTIPTDGITYEVVRATVVSVPDTSTVVQCVQDIGGTNPVSCALLEMADTTNNIFIMMACHNGTASRTWDPDAADGFTELTDTNDISASTDRGVTEIQYNIAAAGAVTADATLSAASSIIGGVALELAYAAESTPVALAGAPSHLGVFHATGELDRLASIGPVYLGVFHAQGAISAFSAATVPDAPTGLAVQILDLQGPKARLTWTDNADDETSYHVERASDWNGATGTFAEVESLAPDVETADDDGSFQPGQEYAWRVFARNAAGDSDDSNVVTATPSPATDWTMGPIGRTLRMGRRRALLM
jgi:hypothetical protein